MQLKTDTLRLLLQPASKNDWKKDTVDLRVLNQLKETLRFGGKIYKPSTKNVGFII